MLIHKSGGLSNVGLNKHLPSKAQIEHGRTEVYFYLLPHSRAFNNHDTVHILETFLFKITNMGVLKFQNSLLPHQGLSTTRTRFHFMETFLFKSTNYDSNDLNMVLLYY